MATIVRSISPTPAQQPHVDLGPGVVALEAGRDDEQAVGAHERGEHARAARQRRRDEVAADAPEAHAHPVVHPHRRRELARDPRSGPRVLGRRRALERGEHRRGEDVEGQRGRDRIAGRPEDRGRPDRAHDDRMARADRDAMDGERPEPLDDARRCGRRARRSTRRRRSRGRRVSAASRTAAAIRSGSSGSDLRAHGLAARRLGLRREHERVRVEDHAGRRVGADRADLVAGRAARRRRGGGGRATSTAPAAAAAATSTARRRWPSGSSSSPALTSSPIERTCW